jgi:hypothetical protein
VKFNRYVREAILPEIVGQRFPVRMVKVLSYSQVQIFRFSNVEITRGVPENIDPGLTGKKSRIASYLLR